MDAIVTTTCLIVLAAPPDGQVDRQNVDRKIAGQVDGDVAASPPRASAAALARPTPPRAALLPYTDAAGSFAIERAAPSLAGLEGGAAHLVDPRSGRRWPVRIDAHAIVQVPKGRSVDRVLAELHLEPVASLMPSLGLWRVRDARGRYDGAELAASLAGAVRAGRLVQASPDMIVERRATDIDIPPNDPQYGGQWYLQSLDIEAAWAISDGDPNTTVVVIDNGCDAAHPDLVENLASGLDVIDDDEDANFQPGVAGNEHGTACAGIVAARGNNATGISGVCPECQVRCVRLLGAALPVSATVRALRFALDVDAAVVSNSWSYVGGMPAPGPVAAAIAEVQQAGRQGLGTLFVFAAGNENREIGGGELAALPGVLTVGAINNFDEATAFSNRGRSIDLTAPTGTLTTDISGGDGADPGDYTNRFGGTSAACPVAAGVAALLASADPTATADEIQTALLQTLRPAPFAAPDPDGHDIRYGFGIIAPAPALQQLTGMTPVPAPDAGVATPDAGFVAVDGGAVPGGLDEESSGCTATRPASRGTPVAALWVVLAALGLRAAAARRRRRQTATSVIR